MSNIRFLQLDVFAEHAGGGNPLGVVLGAEDWSDAAMQSFANWTDLVETTYLLPPGSAGASYRVRIFTPEKEIAFAGHPTIGSAHAALETGFAALAEGQMVQECGAGLLPIRARGEGSTRVLLVRSPAASIVLEGYGIDARLGAILAGQPPGILPPAFIAGGRRWWLAEFGSEVALRAWQPDHAAIRALALATESLGLCVFARSSDPGFELVVRAFPAGVGIVEDPASGAANGLIAAYIAQREPDGKLARGYRVSQGREMGHDASIEVAFDEDGGVWVGGRTHLVIDGMVFWGP